MSTSLPSRRSSSHVIVSRSSRCMVLCYLLTLFVFVAGLDYHAQKPLIPSAQLDLEGVPKTALSKKIRDALEDEVDDTAALAAVQSALQAAEQRRQDESTRKRDEEKRQKDKLKAQQAEEAVQQAHRDLLLVQEEEKQTIAKRRLAENSFQPQTKPKEFVSGTETTGGSATSLLHEIDDRIAMETADAIHKRKQASTNGAWEKKMETGGGAKSSKSSRRQELLQGQDLPVKEYADATADAGAKTSGIIDLTILTPDRSTEDSLRRSDWLQRNDGSGEYDTTVKSALNPDIDADISPATRSRISASGIGADLKDKDKMEAWVDEQKKQHKDNEIRNAAYKPTGASSGNVDDDSDSDMGGDGSYGSDYDDSYDSFAAYDEGDGDTQGDAPPSSASDPRIAAKVAALLAEVKSKGIKPDFSVNAPPPSPHSLMNAQFASGAVNEDVAKLVAQLKAEEAADPLAATKRHDAIVYGTAEEKMHEAVLASQLPVLEGLVTNMNTNTIGGDSDNSENKKRRVGDHGAEEGAGEEKVDLSALSMEEMLAMFRAQELGEMGHKEVNEEAVGEVGAFDSTTRKVDAKAEKVSFTPVPIPPIVSISNIVGTPSNNLVVQSGEGQENEAEVEAKFKLKLTETRRKGGLDERVFSDFGSSSGIALNVNTAGAGGGVSMEDMIRAFNEGNSLSGSKGKGNSKGKEKMIKSLNANAGTGAGAESTRSSESKPSSSSSSPLSHPDVPLPAPPLPVHRHDLLADFAAGIVAELPPDTASAQSASLSRVEQPAKGCDQSTVATSALHAERESVAVVREERDMLHAALLHVATVLRISRSLPLVTNTNARASERGRGSIEDEWGPVLQELFLTVDEVLTIAQSKTLPAVPTQTCAPIGSDIELLSTRLQAVQKAHKANRLLLESCRLDAKVLRMEHIKRAGAGAEAGAVTGVQVGSKKSSCDCAAAIRDAVAQNQAQAKVAKLPAAKNKYKDSLGRDAVTLDALHSAIQTCEQRVIDRDEQLAKFRQFKRSHSNKPVGTVLNDATRTETASATATSTGVGIGADAVSTRDIKEVEVVDGVHGTVVNPSTRQLSSKTTDKSSTGVLTEDPRPRLKHKDGPSKASDSEGQGQGQNWLVRLWRYLRDTFSGGKADPHPVAKDREGNKAAAGGTLASTPKGGGRSVGSTSSVNSNNREALGKANAKNTVATSSVPAAVLQTVNAKKETDTDDSQVDSSIATSQDQKTLTMDPAAQYHASLSEEQREQEEMARSFYDDRGIENVYEQSAQFLDHFYDDYCVGAALQAKAWTDTYVPLAAVRILVSLWAAMSWVLYGLWSAFCALLTFIPGYDTVSARLHTHSALSRRQVLRWLFDAGDFLFQQAHSVMYFIVRFFTDDDLWTRVQYHVYAAVTEVYLLFIWPVQHLAEWAVEYDGLGMSCESLISRWAGPDLLVLLKPLLVYSIMAMIFWKVPTVLRAVHNKVFRTAVGGSTVMGPPVNGAISSSNMPSTPLTATATSTSTFSFDSKIRRVLAYIFSCIAWPFRSSWSLVKRGGRYAIGLSSALLLVLLSPFLFLTWLYKKLWLREKSLAQASMNDSLIAGDGFQPRPGGNVDRSRILTPHTGGASTPRGGMGGGRALDTPRSYLKKSQEQEQHKWAGSAMGIGGGLRPLSEDLRQNSSGSLRTDTGTRSHAHAHAGATGSEAEGAFSLDSLMAPPQNRIILDRGTSRVSTFDASVPGPAPPAAAAVTELGTIIDHNSISSTSSDRTNVSSIANGSHKPSSMKVSSVSLLERGTTPGRRSGREGRGEGSMGYTTATGNSESELDSRQQAQHAQNEQGQEREREQLQQQQQEWLQREVQRRKKQEADKQDRLKQQQEQIAAASVLVSPPLPVSPVHVQVQGEAREAEHENTETVSHSPSPPPLFFPSPQRSPSLPAPAPEDVEDAAQMAERYRDYFNMHVSPSSSANASPKHGNPPADRGAGQRQEQEQPSLPTNWKLDPAGYTTASLSSGAGGGHLSGVRERDMGSSGSRGRSSGERVTSSEIFDLSDDNEIGEVDSRDSASPPMSAPLSIPPLLTAPMPVALPPPAPAIQAHVRTPPVQAVNAESMDRTPLPLTGYENYSYNDNRMNSYNGNGSTNNIQGLEGTVQMDIQNSIDDRTGEEESYMQRSPLPHLLTADAGTGASILQSEQEQGREEDEYDGDDWEEETHDAEQELYASAELREDSQGHFHGQQQQQQYHYQAQYQRGEEQWQGPGHGQEQEQGNYSYGQAYYQVGGGETAEESWDVDLDQLVSASNIHIGIGTGTGAGAGIGSTEDEDDGGDRWEQDLDSIAFRIGQDEGQEYGDGGGIGEETLELDADASVEYVQEQARGREVEETGEEGIYERLDYSDLNTTAEEFAPVTTHIPPVHAPIMGPPRQGQTQTTSQGQGQTYNSMV